MQALTRQPVCVAPEATEVSDWLASGRAWMSFARLENSKSVPFNTEAVRNFRIARRALRDRMVERLFGAIGGSPASPAGGYRFGSHGKPYIDAVGAFFSSSYSGAFVGVLLAPAECGLDIEDGNTDMDLDGVARIILSPAALLDWTACGRPVSDVLESWTRREALGKAAGSGLTSALLQGELRQPYVMPDGNCLHHEHLVLPPAVHVAVAAPYPLARDLRVEMLRPVGELLLSGTVP